MPGSNADVRGLCGLVRPIAEVLPGDVTQSEHRKHIAPFIVPRRLHRILEAALWRGSEEAPGSDTARGSNTWHGLRPTFEPDASPEVRR